MRTPVALTMLAVWIAAVSGCHPMLKVEAPKAPAFTEAQSQVRVGVAEVDITPPVGLGMFGHGPDARVASGTALRLRCQAFVILGAGTTQQPGESLALLPCDIAAPGLLLQREVARRVADKQVPIGAERILLMATHTHHAPAHYFGVKNYTGPFSSRRTGHDPRLLALLADRMATAIISAYADATDKPARIGWAQVPLQQRLQRNRDPQPFLRNQYAPAWLQQRVSAAPERPEEAAVDPTLSVLRVDRLDAAIGGYQPLAVFSVLGMHPTANSNTATLYSGDVFGYATRYVTRAIAAEHPGAAPVIAGMANGIEGDVMAARQVAGLREARRFGARVADEIFAAWQWLGADTTRMETSARVQVAYRELSLAGAQTAVGAVLCMRPELGTAAGGGANDHPTLLRLFPQYNPGVTSTARTPCGHPKLPILMISGEAEAGTEFPDVAPVSVVRVGTHTLVALPAEVTTMTGVRIREAVADELGLPLPDLLAPAEHRNVGRGVVVVGLTNEYLQYVATPEEYELQYYEGASTLYGPNTARFLRDHARCLAGRLAGRDADTCRMAQCAAVNELTEWKRPCLGDAELLSSEPQPTAAPASPATPEVRVTRDGLLTVHMDFLGPLPDSVRARKDLWVQVLRADSRELVDDDQGTAVATEWQPYTHDGLGWAANWIPELARARAECGNQFVFVIGNEQGTVTSAPFTLDCSHWTDLSKVWP